MGCILGTPEEQEAALVNKQIERDIKRSKKQMRQENKILLLGAGESGKSTIVKQMKILHDNGYTNEERLQMRPVIFGNTFCSMVAMLRAIKCLKIPLGDQERENDAARFLALESEVRDDEFPAEMAGLLLSLWKDSGVQECFRRSREYQLNDSASYYLDAVERLATPGYIPNDQDVLRARVRTTGIIEFIFKFKDTTFKIVDVGGQRSERRKWISCFEGVTAIVFVTSLSEYDLVLFEDAEQNRMVESLQLFDQICNNLFFINTAIILFLNKKDLFADKITKSPLTLCFSEYDGPNTYEAAANYIQYQFTSLKKVSKQNMNREVYAHFTCATDTNNIDVVFDAVSDIVIQQNLVNCGLS